MLAVVVVMLVGLVTSREMDRWKEGSCSIVSFSKMSTGEPFCWGSLRQIPSIIKVN